MREALRTTARYEEGEVCVVDVTFDIEYYAWYGH